MQITHPNQMQEILVARPTYKVRVPELMQDLKERGLLYHSGKHQSPAMYLVRAIGLAQATAYKATDPTQADEIDMNSIWKIFSGMRANEITVDNGQGERPIRFFDVCKILDE